MEESTTLVNEPPQDKICHSGRFLDSHSLPRNDMSGGGTIHPHRLYSERGGRHSSRPYIRNTFAPIVPTIQNAVPHLIHRLWRSPFPEGEGFGRNPVQQHGFYSQRPRNGTQAVPYGFAGRWYRSSTRVIFGTLLGDESSPLHCVVPFNRTGCNCNVAGGIIAAPTCATPLRLLFLQCGTWYRASFPPCDLFRPSV